METNCGDALTIYDDYTEVGTYCDADIADGTDQLTISSGVLRVTFETDGDSNNHAGFKLEYRVMVPTAGTYFISCHFF